MRGTHASVVAALREAAWLDATRARGYCRVLAAISVIVGLGYLALSRDGIDPMGKPVGTDFASFWTASLLALEGRPAEAWDMVRHGAVQAAKFGPGAGYAAFFYPPPYLLVCLPLALLPYLASLALWLAGTFYAWLRMVTGWLEASGERSLGLLPIATFPAVLINVGHGQNGFLTATLMGAGALLQPSRPWLAGVLFGGLVIKPQLGVLLPFYLVMARDWRCVLATGATAAAICMVSLAAFGWPVWHAFLANADNASAVLAHNTVGYHKMQSVFAAARLLGAPQSLAVALQVGMLALTLWLLYRVRRAGDGPANGAALCVAALLATPFVLDYDLTLLAVPLVWLYAKGRPEGFVPWEKLVLAMGFLLPLVSRSLAALYLPVAPFVMLAVLMLIVQRSARPDS